MNAMKKMIEASWHKTSQVEQIDRLTCTYGIDKEPVLVHGVLIKEEYRNN